MSWYLIAFLARMAFTLYRYTPTEYRSDKIATILKAPAATKLALLGLEPKLRRVAAMVPM